MKKVSGFSGLFKGDKSKGKGSEEIDENKNSGSKEIPPKKDINKISEQVEDDEDDEKCK